MVCWIYFFMCLILQIQFFINIFFESVADLHELCFFTDEMATLVISDRQF